jgi:hypothetical protein
VGEQARDDSVDVFDGEHDTTDAQRVHRRVHGPKPDRFGRVELIELDATVAVRGPHQREGGANVLEPDQAVDRRSLDLRLAFELDADFDEERLGRLEAVENDENVCPSAESSCARFSVSLYVATQLCGVNCSEKPFLPGKVRRLLGMRSNLTPPAMAPDLIQRPEGPDGVHGEPAAGRVADSETPCYDFVKRQSGAG